ncbi:MAG TPA: glycine cleavage system protein GcvH [Acidimicrobiales bacterium]|nr:glycine cleavage system protein GcvH [Acidimicrobiales bacterium]
MAVPHELRYTADHEWARQEEGGLRVGITDFAQKALGDIVFVQLPSVGTEVRAGELLGEVESTKSVSEIYAPVSGRVTGVNDALATSPQRVNDDPYGQGWLCVIAASSPEEVDGLLGAESYEQLTAD